jgi:hypothetical protein
MTPLNGSPDQTRYEADRFHAGRLQELAEVMRGRGWMCTLVDGEDAPQSGMMLLYPPGWHGDSSRVEAVVITDPATLLAGLPVCDGPFFAFAATPARPIASVNDVPRAARAIEHVSGRGQHPTPPGPAGAASGQQTAGNDASRHLRELAAQLRQRRCRAQMFGETLTVSPPASARGERVIACDGRLFRWDSETGIVLGPVDDVTAAADDAVTVLERSAR